MKKLILSLAIAMSSYCSYAQWATGTGTIYPATITDKVGIGTTSPGTALDVYGTIRSTTGGLQIGKFSIASNPLLSIGLDRSEFSASAIINGWGNSSNPGISVGTTRTDGTAFSVVTGVTLDANYLPYAAGTSAFTVLGNGYVGVGTTTPGAPLEIRQSGDASVPLRLFGGSTSYTTNKTNMLAFMISDTQGSAKAAAAIQGISNNRDVTGGYLSFLTSNANIYDPNALIERMRIDPSGNVGIGTTLPDTKLAVKGTIHTQEVKVDMTGWNDYVFDKTYPLKSLSAVKSYIDENHHLPEIPSEAEVIKNGVNVGEMLKLQTKKIEELTLYLIDKDKQLFEQNAKLADQQKKNDDQEARIAALEKALSKLTENQSK